MAARLLILASSCSIYMHKVACAGEGTQRVTVGSCPPRVLLVTATFSHKRRIQGFITTSLETSNPSELIAGLDNL